jgi:hypothetical protein
MSGWSTPPEDARTTFKVIATYDCIAFDGMITRTWMQDRDEELTMRQRLYRLFYRILWPNQPLPIPRHRASSTHLHYA